MFATDDRSSENLWYEFNVTGQMSAKQTSYQQCKHRLTPMYRLFQEETRNLSRPTLNEKKATRGNKH